MSLSFSLQQDKGVRENNPLQPFKIVSLWDVLEFYAKNWLGIAHEVGRMVQGLDSEASWQSRLELACAATGQPYKPPTPRLLPSNMVTALSNFLDTLRQMELDTSMKAVEGIIGDIESGRIKTEIDAKAPVVELMHVIEFELQSKRLFMMKAKEAQCYEIEETFLGQEVIDKFDLLLGFREDACEAANCYAVGRYTACVFHLMRIMERCVQKLGNDLDVPEKITCEKEWQVILNQIRCKVKEKWPGEKNSHRIRLESVINHLESVKVAWRNPTMHPKATYTPREAEKIMQAVQVFVEDFSTLRDSE